MTMQTIPAESNDPPADIDMRPALAYMTLMESFLKRARSLYPHSLDSLHFGCTCDNCEPRTAVRKRLRESGAVW